ncbi:MAG: sensor histidine kinase [Phycisphaerae bacterium]
MRRLSYLMAGGAWLVLSLAAGVFLVHSASAGARRADLVSRGRQLAGIMAADVGDRGALQQDLDIAGHFDPALVYGMVWKADGEVLAHSNREVVGQFLDAGRWPALDGEERSRLASLEVPEWSPGNPHVLEYTTEIGTGKPGVFLSLAVAREPLVDGGAFLLVLGFSAVSTGILVAGIVLARRRFERARREIVQEARARTSLLTERGMLASVLAHEIRSPLTALRFNLHALRQLLGAGEGAHSEKQTELTDRCEREIRRLDNMLTDFLRHTQVITGAIEPTALNGVIEEAVAFLRPTLERSGVHISLHLDAGNPRVAVHPDELRQVILNLTANAQEAMSDLPATAARTLAISTISDERAESPTATLLIRDSGKGIPAEARERIFEPFFSTKPNGSGLGLTLVRRVISGAGGTVLYESSPEENVGGKGEGAGTTFRITLPRVGGAGGV